MYIDDYYNKLKKTVVIAITDNESEELKLIKKANNDLRDLCSNDELWHETLNIQMARMDEMQRMHDAIEEGEERGERKANLKTAKSFKKLGVDIATIAKATGLSIEEIEKL